MTIPTRPQASSLTIGYDGDPCLFDVRPVLEDLSDTALVLDADKLAGDEVSTESHATKKCGLPNPRDACRYANS